MGYKHCTTDRKILWIVRGTVLKKINLIWSYSMRVSLSANELFNRFSYCYSVMD